MGECVAGVDDVREGLLRISQAAGVLHDLAIMVREDPLRIEVDAALVERSQFGVTTWVLYPEDPGNPVRWNHPAAHGDQYFGLTDVLMGIALSYVMPRRDRRG